MARKPTNESSVKEMETPSTPKPRAKKRRKALDPNPKSGKRRDFRKITITMSPEILEELRKAREEWRALGRPFHVSELIREAVVYWLKDQKSLIRKWKMQNAKTAEELADLLDVPVSQVTDYGDGIRGVRLGPPRPKQAA